MLNRFDLKTEKFDVIKKDKSHWNLASQFLSIPGEFVEFEKAIRENAINDIKSMEGIQSYNGNLYIDKDGGLFVRGFENETSGNTGLYFKENYFGKLWIMLYILRMMVPMELQYAKTALSGKTVK
jgi:hypothetical protein